MPMWVSGSQPSSCWQIIKNSEAGWTFALRLDENKPWVPCPCSKVDTDATKREKKIPPEPCQYILIFCLAEKHRLDTPSHCLENNFTPVQSDVQTHAPHRLRHGNWSLKGDFRQMGGILPQRKKQNVYGLRRVKIIIIKCCRINGWKSPVELECKAEVKFQTECQRCSTKHQSALVEIRIQQNSTDIQFSKSPFCLHIFHIFTFHFEMCYQHFNMFSSQGLLHWHQSDRGSHSIRILLLDVLWEKTYETHGQNSHAVHCVIVSLMDPLKNPWESPDPMRTTDLKDVIGCFSASC